MLIQKHIFLLPAAAVLTSVLLFFFAPGPRAAGEHVPGSVVFYPEVGGAPRSRHYQVAVFKSGEWRLSLTFEGECGKTERKEPDRP